MGTVYFNGDLQRHARRVAKSYQCKLVAWCLQVHERGASLCVRMYDRTGFEKTVIYAL